MKAHGSNPAGYLFLSVKFYYNVAICLCTVPGCFHAKTAKLRNCNRVNDPQNLKYLLSNSLQKVAHPCFTSMPCDVCIRHNVSRRKIL